MPLANAPYKITNYELNELGALTLSGQYICHHDYLKQTNQIEHIVEFQFLAV
ncbi:MAG: hypothetical protein V7K32_05845 [Nostoc sp.]|uniref:hypothetical protein n=1 Tax=Nostoc sp. TaxID=1180 RepID=UPI002FF9C701